MNERFEELKRRAVAEADTSHIDFDNMSHTEIQMLGDIAVEEKFAQLIVRECIAKVEMRKKFAIEDEHIVDHAFDLLVYDLESHFGVEE